MNFTEDLQVANKHMKLCSALSKQKHSEIHFIPTRQAKITSPVGENVEPHNQMLQLQMEADIIIMENIWVMP